MPNCTVLLDGRTFSRRYQRDRVIEFSSQVGTTWATLECVCSEATALGRIAEAVAANSHLAANRTPELYREIRKAWEPIDQPKLVIDTDENLETCVDRALRYLTCARPFVALNMRVSRPQRCGIQWMTLRVRLTATP